MTLLSLDSFSTEYLKNGGRADGQNPRGGSRAVKAGNLSAAVGRGAGEQADAAGCGPDRQVPVPRRPDAFAGYLSGKESLALPGRVQRGRRRDRVGDAGQWHQLPPWGRVPPSRPSSLSRRTNPADQVRHGAQAARAGDGGGGR